MITISVLDAKPVWSMCYEDLLVYVQVCETTLIQAALSEDLKLQFFEHNQTSSLRRHISSRLHLHKIHCH